MGTPELDGVGKHCCAMDCGEIDFLPFTCDQCCQVFCLEHRSSKDHLCGYNAKQKDVTVLVCPLCARGVRLFLNQDPNIIWENHVNIDCDPSNYQKATSKKRCPVPGCNDLLTFSNNIKCRDCAKKHCLKHRFASDHKCPGPHKPDSGFPFIGLLKKSPKGDSNDLKSEISSRLSSTILNAASSVRASAEAGMLKLGNMTSQTIQKARDGIAQSSNVNGLVEQCPQCPARFPTLTSLISHVESCHENNTRRIQNSVLTDLCPKCYKGFQNPVLLVEHVERDHRI